MFSLHYAELVESWNKTLAVVAKLADVPVALVMRLENENISVFSKSPNDENPYQVGDCEKICGSGLYCEHVINTRGLLNVPNALTNTIWDSNPDIKLNMIAYLGLPIEAENHETFGTICILDNKERHFPIATIELLKTIRNNFEMQLKILHQQHLADEHRQAEELATLIRGISHEINTPLGTSITATSIIESHIEKLQKSLKTKTLSHKSLQSQLNIMEESVKSMSHALHTTSEKVNTLQNLLIDQEVKVHQNVDISLVINDVLKLYQVKLSKRAINCSFSHDSKTLIQSYLVPTLLQEVVVILLNNSLEHGLTAVSEPKIHLDLKRYKDTIQLHYYDNGIGIEKALQDQVFAPFFTTSRRTGCIGLGLSVVKRIVCQQLRGGIELLPSDTGIHFLINFPIRKDFSTV
ncbi:GAF domain-containing sensor histidine kinase [Cognaticolwellia mytili]|uniref:GAF domain-containing sensor histidine kinase n=1 Tax=Cognaticolwellia mytili TaxID=1888913 RepID=UPI001F42776C|nr:GAF domain-containing sensor histidine kinase [Cognaticolwellia mytili]